MSSRAQIVATIGPSSEKPGVLKAMIEAQMDVARFNFAWFDVKNDWHRIEAVRAIALECGRSIPIIADLPRIRVQLAEGHTYDASMYYSITQEDEEMLNLCAEHRIEYIALSFVGSDDEVTQYREALQACGSSARIIAKIERKTAVDKIDNIIAVSDAIMIARGDLGNEVPLEEIPFVQKVIISKANAARKPVITATQMLLSMTEHEEPTRAEVTDVEEAIVQGSDVVMLSEETSTGKFPVEAVTMMERILVEAERHCAARNLHLL